MIQKTSFNTEGIIMETVRVKYNKNAVKVQWPRDNGTWTTHRCKWTIESAQEAKKFLEYLFDYCGKLEEFYNYEFVVEEDHDN